MPARFNQFSTSFLKPKNSAFVAENDPMGSFGGKPTPTAKNCVEQFLNELSSQKVSPSTLRNYSSDILQFIDFSQDNNIQTLLSGKNFQAFFAAQQEKGLKSSSIQRKIVSLKMFSQWVEKNILSTPVASSEPFSAPQPYIPPQAPHIPVQENIASFAANLEQPVQPEPSPVVETQEQYVAPVFTPPSKPEPTQDVFVNSDTPVSEITEENLETFAPSQNLPENKSRYSRWILGPYFHLATLVIFFIFISILWYRQFFVTVPQNLAYPAAPVTPDRILSFQARLTDAAGSPITTATNTTFRLYNDPTAGSLLWNSGTCSIDPDQDGIFSTILGSTCGAAIDQSVFSENNQVWLEITVVSDTLTPRQRIASVPYALNSETIQGFPVNSTGSATKSTVLVMNQWGEVLLGEQSPRLRSVSGTFTISGSTLNLVTNSGSNGDITLDPDGTGRTNVIGNLFNNGYIYTNGATISATYAGNIPLTINGTGGQVVTVNNVGDITTSGDLNVNGGDINSSADITISPAGNNVIFSNNTVLNIGGAGATAYNFIADSTAGNTTAAGDNDLYIQDILEVDGAARFDSSVTLSTLNTAGGVVYTNGSGQLLVSAAGTGGDCLLSGGTGAPTWGTCSSGGLAGTWRIVNGTQSPVNDTLDLLIGSSASNSAKFAVLNVNSGTPTATLSAGAGTGSYLTATGALQTAANQTLTLGGSTTGDIALSPLNGSGNVLANIGASQLLNVLTGNLKVGNGTPTVTLNGEDAYVEGTFEVDGAVRFDNSSIVMSTFTTDGGILYTNGSGVLAQSAQGAAGQCLKSNGGGAPSFGNCATDNYWRISNGGISPLNDTLDLLIGNTATISAKFAVINVNSGTPTATLSAGAAGGAYLNAAGSLQTTANQTLTLGGSTTGDIALSPLNGSGNVLANIGASQLFNVLTGNLKVGNGTPDLTQNGEDAYIEGTLEVDGNVRFDGSLTVTTLNNAGSVIYVDGNGQFLASGAGSSGDCLQSGGTGAPTWGSCGSGGLSGTWRIGNGAHSPVNDTLDLLIGSNASSSAKFAVLNVNSGTPTASLSSGATGGSYLSADGSLQTTANQTLTVGGSTTGDISISPLNGSGGVNVNLGSARTLNVLTGNLAIGNAVPSVSLNGEDAFIEGTFEVDGAVRFDNSSITLSSFNTDGGLLYTNGSGVLAQTSQGNAGECLKSNGGGAPSFGPCASANYWRLASGAISPINDTLDFLVGSNATTSAKFAIINVNSGTPTASLSAGATGGSYLSADGSLQTTANQTLTLGGSTTGDIALSPLNSNGGVNVNLGAARLFNILSGNLKVGNGTPDLTQDGEDAYIEGTLEVDGDTRFDGTVTISGLNNAGSVVYVDANGQLLANGAGSNGDCLQSGGTGAPTWGSCGTGGLSGSWRIGNGAHSPVNDTLDLLIGSNASTSAKFAVLNVNSGTPTATLSAGAGTGSYLTATGALQTAANQTLTIGGSTTGDIALSPLNGSGNVIANIGASQLLNVLSGNLKIGNGAPTVTLNGEDAYIEGTFEVDGAVRFDNSSITLSNFTTDGGLLYTNSSGVVAQTAAGNSGECLKSNGSGAPTFGVCATDNFWRVATGAISPVNDTLDLLVGSNATASAKFAVMNVNSGTPTASLSAGATGGTYLTAAGNLQTTASQTLTIGGTTTGDIALSPLNAGGGVDVNLGAARLFNVLTGNLKVGNAAPTVALNGEDAYIEGTLEADGAVRFDNSSITLSSFTTNGGLLYTNGSGVVAQTAAGNSGECLKSIGGGTPVFGPCSSGDNWRIASGTISPNNDTLDLLIGANATTSAKFAVMNVNSGTPTASLSAGATGGAYLTAAGTLQTTASQTLTIGGSTTGDIALSPLNGGGNVTANLGSSQLFNVLTGNLKVGNGAPTVTLNGEDAYVEGTFEVDGAIRFDNSSVTLSSFTNNGGILYTNGSGVLAQTAVGNSGECLTSVGGGTPVWANCSAAAGGNFWRIATGAISPINDTLDFLVGSNATTSAKFAVMNVNSGTPTASLSAGATGGAYLTAAGALQTTASQTLTIGGSTTGDIALSPLNSAGNVFANLGASQLLNVLTGNLKVGNGAPTVTLNGEDAYIEGTFEVDGAVRLDNSSITLSSFTNNGGLLYTNGSGVLAQTAVGNSGECLTSVGGGTPVWANCSAAAGNLWRLASGALSPVNDTTDLLIGSNATASAKFAFMNVNSGTPTASLSAGAAGGTYLTAAGTMQTTANQTLTLGGSTTGNISLLPLNGAGSVTITSDLSLGARSTDLVTLTQANNGSNNSTGNLLQLTNSDTGSTASLLDITQAAGGGSAITFSGSDPTSTLVNTTGVSLTTGRALDVNASSLTSGSAINFSTNLGSSSLSDFTGKVINIAYSRTLTGNGTTTDSGNHLNIARTAAQTTGSGTFNLTGDVAKITSTCSASGGTCTDSSHILTVQQNYASATGSVLDITNAGTGVGILLTSSSTGDLMQLDASGAGTTANGLVIRQTGAGTLTDAIDLSDETITNALNVGANTITGAGYLLTSTASGLTINSTSADLALTTTTSGNITATPGTANDLFNVLTGNLKVGNGTPDVTLNGEDAYIEGTLEADGAVRFDNSSITLSSFTANGGLLYTNGSGVLAQTAVGNSGECLKSNGGGAPTFQSCGGGGGSNWRITNGGLSPINDTLDLLVGSTATTSAKFAIINVNSGTPTASLSAGSAGGAFLSATGSLQTTAAQLLTIGGSTTGDIMLSPKNGAGLITFNEDSLTTGTGMNLTADALTSGTGFFGQSTSTALTTGKLLSFDWSPTGSTEIYAGSGSALLNLNIGTYGNIDKILNITDDGSTVFSVSQSMISSALPHEFTAAGDVSMAYDLQFTNQTASYIKSNAPLQIEAGESFENNNLTLKTYGTGKIIMDGGFSINAQETLTDSTTPDVSGASHFVEANGTNRLVTNFTGGTAGQIIVIEQTTANLDFDCTSNANFNCGNADITGAAGSIYTWISDGIQWNMISYMNASTGGGNDLAEYFPGSENLEAGDIITVDSANPVTIKKETNRASDKVIGIISTQPGITLGDATPNSYKVALAGRVPVKIDPNSPEIHPGDHITSSNLAGTGRLAEQAGIAIGVALEGWKPNTGDNDVMVYVNRTWYEPSEPTVVLGNDGSLISNYTIQAPTQSGNGRYTIISNATNQVMQKLSVLAQLVVGEIQAGFIKTQQLIADNLTVTQKLTSPEIETNSLKTSLISPIGNGDISFKLGNDQDSELTVKNASDEAIFNVDQDGNTDIAGNLNVAQDASVAGEVTATSGRFEQLQAQKANLENLNIGNDATISGQLYLADGRSIQSIIDDNNTYLASVSAQTEQITQQMQSAPQALSSSSFDEFLSQLTGSQDASVSAAIAALAQNQNITLQSTDMVLAPDAIFVKEYLNVAGYAQFNNANVSNSLTIGSGLILTQDTIASANSTLFIQPTTTSSVNILAGLLVLNPNGNVELNGNLIVSGDVKVGQKLNTNSIQPNDYSSDFTLKLATQSAVLGAETQSKFAILDASNSAVASIDASGSARFNELATNGLVIKNPTANASDSASLSESQKSQTIGSSVLPAGTTEFTIENYNVSDNVLINLTPTSDTANQVLFVKSKETCTGPVNFSSCKKSFTVGIKNAVTQDISFNFWIVKVQ